MNTLLTPVVLLVLSVALFFTFTDKQYEKVKQLKVENQEYEVAIENSKELLRRRDQLLAQYNSFSQQDLRKLERLVPDSIDNVRLIIDINGVTSKYGVEIKNLKLNTVKAEAADTAPIIGPDGQPVNQGDNKPYHSATITFSINSSYDTFVKILKDLEESLRILDISSVKFTSTEAEPYQYDVTVKTYWMK
jgi:Tfp pilus assembly protein PilO